MLKYIYSLALVILISDIITCECPNEELLNPCSCGISPDYGDLISCGGKEAIDLVKVFTTLSQNLTADEKHFKRFELTNTAINELKENTFKDIIFDEIFVLNCTNLTQIHRNAFSVTNLNTYYLWIANNPGLNQLENNTLFDITNDFVNIKWLLLNGNNITEIPSNAFTPKNGTLDQLTLLELGLNPIAKLGNNAFKTLHALEYLYLSEIPLNYIPENGFAFENTSNTALIVHLDSNQSLNSSSFALNSINQLVRPTTIDLSFNPKITYLEERIFLPFLMANAENSVQIYTCPIDCDDCRNYWIIKQNFLARVKSNSCANEKLLSDKTNFNNCTSLM